MARLAPFTSLARPSRGTRSWRGAALRFWLASLAGFVGYGYIVAELMMEGAGEGIAHRGSESLVTALVLGLAAAAALGVPAAMLFGGVMRRVEPGHEWQAALLTGAAMTALLYFPFSSAPEVLLSAWGFSRVPVLVLVAAAVAMMPGAVAGAAAAAGARPGRAGVR